MIRAIIFDMDGVLVLGVNKYHIKAWDEALKEFKLNIKLISEEEYNKLEGMKGNEILSIILKRNHKSLPASLKEKIYSRKKQIFQEIDSPHVDQETKTLLINLGNKDYKLALASGNNRQVVEKLIDNEHLEDIFDVVVTGDEVKRGKPYPDVYLRTVQELKFEKDECVVIENAPLGVKAAKTAGLFVVAITSTLSDKFLTGSDRIIDNLKELNPILQNI